jgi:LAO/AO transport system kinase
MPSPDVPDWVPEGGGEGFATRLIREIPTGSPDGTVRRARRGVSDPRALAELILAGDRGALARGITLVESTAPPHRAAADTLLGFLAPHVGAARRVGITGVPGAGKSTFINRLGVDLLTGGARLAVLSIDPSSPVSGGSILGDKTRMEALARDPRAFIRPSPSGCALGGVARRTRETISLCEAAGFDTILVETVGVGQSEVLVRSMVDVFVVLAIAGAGDELQGMKKGILELADLLVVNKADGENRIRAEAARVEFARALHYLEVPPGEWTPRVLACSAVTGEGMAETWAAVGAYFDWARSSGSLQRRRREQQIAWLDALVLEGLRERFNALPRVAAERERLEAAVAAGSLPPPIAAERLLGAARFREAED